MTLWLGKARSVFDSSNFLKTKIFEKPRLGHREHSMSCWFYCRNTGEFVFQRVGWLCLSSSWKNSSNMWNWTQLKPSKMNACLRLATWEYIWGGNPFSNWGCVECHWYCRSKTHLLPVVSIWRMDEGVRNCELCIEQGGSCVPALLFFCLQCTHDLCFPTPAMFQTERMLTNKILYGEVWYLGVFSSRL